MLKNGLILIMLSISIMPFGEVNTQKTNENINPKKTQLVRVF